MSQDRQFGVSIHSKICRPAVILEPAPKPHSYWCRMENYRPETKNNMTSHQATLEYNRVQGKTDAFQHPDGRKPHLPIYTSNGWE